MKFLYVFDKETRDKLIDAGYTLLKSNDSKEVYVFENRGIETFDLNTAPKNVFPSNTLTF